MTASNDIQLTKYSIPNPLSSEKLIRWTWKPLRSFDETLLRTKGFSITVCRNKVSLSVEAAQITSDDNGVIFIGQYFRCAVNKLISFV